MREQGIGSWSSSRRGGQRRQTLAQANLKAKFMSGELKEMRTKSSDSKPQGRKGKERDLEN